MKEVAFKRDTNRWRAFKNDDFEQEIEIPQCEDRIDIYCSIMPENTRNMCLYDMTIISIRIRDDH